MDDEAVAQLALLENLLLNIIHRSPPQSSLLECKALKKKKREKDNLQRKYCNNLLCVIY